MELSIYLSNETIQVVTGTSGNKHVKVKHLYTKELPPDSFLNGTITDEVRIGQTVEDMWKKYKLPKKNCQLVIDSSTIPTKIVTIPSLSVTKSLAIIAGEFAELENTDELLFDYAELIPKLQDGGKKVLACAIEKSFIKTYLDLFKQAGVGIANVNLALCSEIKLLRMNDSTQNKTFITVNLDGSNVIVNLFVQGQYHFTRRRRLFADRRTEDYTAELVQMVSSMIQFNKSEKTGYEVTEIFLLGIKTGEEELYAPALKQLGVGVSILDSLSNVSFSENSEPEHLSDYIYVVGNLMIS